MSKTNDLSALSLKNLFSAALRTASADGVGQDISALEGNLCAVLNAGAATAGTNPTLDVKLQESDTLNGSYTDVPSGAFAQVTTVAGAQKLVFAKNGRKSFIRGSSAHGGTSTPTFPYSLELLGAPKYS